LPRRYLWDDIAAVERDWTFYGPALLRRRVNAEGLGGDARRGAYGARWIEQTIERVHDR
jgi:hypothetical protein